MASIIPHIPLKNSISEDIMAVILETLSRRKLLAFAFLCIVSIIIFFVVGGKVAPAPTSAMLHTAHICVATEGVDELYDPWACKEKLTSIDEARRKQINANRLVFTLQFPHRGLEMTPWFQFIAGSLSIDVGYNPDNKYGNPDKSDVAPIMTFDARLAYRFHNDSEHKWELLAKSDSQERELVCHFVASKTTDGGYYDCDEIPLFEIGSVHYENYLVNIHLPTHTDKNKHIGEVSDFHVVEIHQNGGFTRVWFAIKTVLSLGGTILFVWFVKRMRKLGRQPILLEKALFGLGAVTCFMNFPIEWFTLWVDMPAMLLFSDIRQGLFYAMLLCFWIIFCGEHLVDQPDRNNLKVYWKQIGAIGFGSLCLLVFDLCERGYQLKDPFSSIWATKTGRQLAYAFIIVAAICACLYFLFLLFMVFRVFWNIRGKRSGVTTMSRARRLQYDGLIYRFEVLMVVTVVCAALTVVFFIISNVNEAHWKFGDEESTVEVSSALFTGIYGLWNVYVFAVLFLYAPSFAPPAAAPEDENSERLELRRAAAAGEPSESVVYAFAGKSAQE